MGIILSLIIAGIAGWIAGNIMKSGGFGILGNVLLGIVGGFVGQAMLWLVGLGTRNIVGSLIAAVLGAIVVLYLVDYFKRRSGSGAAV
jgi:uncharacterized membrane protein YeaQ/YmgE (transglycosylase-associated protein family)